MTPSQLLQSSRLHARVWHGGSALVLTDCCLQGSCSTVQNGYPPLWKPFVLYIIPFAGHLFSYSNQSHQWYVPCLLQTHRFEQTTLTTIISSSTLLSVWACRLTVPSMSLGPIPTVDRGWVTILEFKNIFKITCCCIHNYMCNHHMFKKRENHRERLLYTVSWCGIRCTWLTQQATSTSVF